MTAVVLVEGPSDAVVLRDLARRLELDGPHLTVESMGGVTNFARSLRAYADRPDVVVTGLCDGGEVRFVAAHELAHVARRHVWKGVAWFALLATPIAFVVAEATRRRGGIGDPANVPLAVLVLIVVELALLPFANAVSRRYEAEADWVALETTRDPVGGRRLFERFATANLASPSPPGWSYALLGTHPSLDDRIAMAEAWARVSARRR